MSVQSFIPDLSNLIIKPEFFNLGLPAYIRIVMFLIISTVLIVVYFNVFSFNKYKRSDHYYIDNIVSAVLLTIYVIYTILYENNIFPTYLSLSPPAT
jgi:hypothetical protein